MHPDDPQALLLASRSPRRAELLAQIGLRFAVLDIAIDEARRPGEAPDAFVERLARAKVRAGAERADEPARAVVAADTAIALDGEVLGKPRGEADGLAMLERLGGRSHEVWTGVAVSRGDALESRTVRSRVSLRALSAAERAAYWATGEPADKAGAYAIQGRGAIFVEHLEGSYSNVVGLPLFETAALLSRFGLYPLAASASRP